MKTADRIKECRKAAGMTQTDLANLIGVKCQTIQKYECGLITNIPIDKIEMMAKIFEVSPIYLLCYDDISPLSNDEFAEIFHSLTPENQSLIRQMMEQLSKAERK